MECKELLAKIAEELYDVAHKMGPFDRDPIIHMENIIESSAEKALALLVLIKEHGSH